LNARGLEIAKALNIRAHEGVYVSLSGPNLESPAEYHFLHTIGGDLVGMSTVPEVIAAKHMDLPVLVMSVVSNQCYPLEIIQETTHESVIATVENAELKMIKLVSALIKEI